VQVQAAPCSTPQAGRQILAILSHDSLPDHIMCKFKRHLVPPRKPDDEYWQFSVTTVFLTTSCASDLMNGLLDFLAADLHSKITKVSQEKFTARAQVMGDDDGDDRDPCTATPCTVKLRVYDVDAVLDYDADQSRTFAVDVQKRTGDAFTFAKFYHRCAAHLERYCRPHPTSISILGEPSLAERIREWSPAPPAVTI